MANYHSTTNLLSSFQFTPLFNSSLDALDDLLTTIPPQLVIREEIEKLLESGKVAMRKSKFMEAIECYEEAMKKVAPHPDHEKKLKCFLFSLR